MNKKYYISTAITYTSGKPHIGNTYEIVLADAIARFKRSLGFDVYFQTGTDEHGQKVEQKAAEKGITPKQFVDEVATEIKRIWDLMNTTYDKFVRTTDKVHMDKVAKIFKKLYDNGDIYKGYYEGLYCTPCEGFYTESQLTDGKCPECGSEVIKTKEEAYFLKMEKYAKNLEKYIEDNPDFIKPDSRKNEMLNNFFKQGISDLCVSRTSFKWGIPVSFDNDHVVYVWIDALSNYITFLGYDIDGNHSEQYKKYWPCDVHLIGKDILRFHTIYWPIILMALGEPLPAQIFGHPWLLSGADKMSKSKNNTIYADDLVSYFGVDAVRYFVLHEMPYASDGNITYELMIERINSDLANILGNLVNRSISMQNLYFEGILQSPDFEGDFDDDLIKTAAGALEKVQEKMDSLRISDAIEEIMTLARRANKYIDETAPWVLAKDENSRQRLGTVLYNILESIRIIAVLLQSFLPETAGRILHQLNTSESSFESIETFGKLKAGDKVNSAEVLFERIDAPKKLEEIYTTLKEKEEAALNQITIDDFAKVHLRVAKVLECEPVPKSAKLLKLIVELGTEKRQVVSGIAEYYKPEDLIGKNVILVANLKPVTIRGVDSFGMILASDSKDGVKVVFADENTQSGSVVR